MLVIDRNENRIKDGSTQGSQELEHIVIFSVILAFGLTSDIFWGACIGFGGQRTVVEQKQQPPM